MRPKTIFCGRFLSPPLISLFLSQSVINTESGALLDSVAHAASSGAEALTLKYPQVKIVDLFTLMSVSSGNSGGVVNTHT